MQLASMNVFYSMWQLEDVIFSQSLLLLWDFFNRHIVVFFETSVLKEVRILRYLHNNSVVLILMLSSKKSYPIPYLYILEKLLYVAGFFYDNVFYTLYLFNCSTLFFIKLFFFFWKIQNKTQYCRTILNSFFIYKRWVFLYKVRTKLLLNFFK